MPESEAAVLENPQAFFPEQEIRPYSADVRLEDGDAIEAAGLTFETVSVPGHSPGHVAFATDGVLFSGDVLFAGSVGRTDLPVRRLGHAGRIDPPPRRPVSAGDRHLPGTRTADHARRRARRQPLSRGAPRGHVKFEAPRGTHDILPPEQPVWRWVIGEAERLCALYGYRQDRDARASRTPSSSCARRRGLRRRPEGDVHVRGPRRPLADTASRGDGADLPRLPSARHAPGAAAGRSSTRSARCGATTARRGAATASTGSCRSRRSAPTTRRRRRADPALRRASRAARGHRLRPRAELDRRRQLPARPTSSSSRVA